MNFYDLSLYGGLFVDGDWIEKKDQDENGTVRLIQLADIGIASFKDKSNKFINKNKFNELHCTALKQNDLLIARLPEPLGRCCIFPHEGNFITAVDISILRIARPDVDVKYVMYFINSPWFREQVNKYESGTTRKRISRKNLAKIEFNIPSIDDQQRIVARIEELFSELDQAEETLQKTKAQLEVYKQAVLKEAFEGKYTSGIRNNNKTNIIEELNRIKRISVIYKDTSGDENEINLMIPKEWSKVRFGDVFEVEVGGTPKRNNLEYWNGDINWVSSGEVQFNRIYHTKEKITKNGLSHTSANIQPIGTVMLGMIGEGKTRGQAAILMVEAAHNQNTAAILVSKTKCIPEYIYYFLYLNYQNTRRVGSGNNQKALNKERVKAIKFPFCSYKEQLAIVQIIEEKMSAFDNVNHTIDLTLKYIVSLRQSILKEAFEGKLV